MDKPFQEIVLILDNAEFNLQDKDVVIIFTWTDRDDIGASIRMKTKNNGVGVTFGEDEDFDPLHELNDKRRYIIPAIDSCIQSLGLQ